MKKIGILLFCVTTILFLVSCSSWLVDLNTPKSEELKAKYDFYENAVAEIRVKMQVTPEQADEIFLVLVDCGLNQDISYIIGDADKGYTVDFGKIGEGVTNLNVMIDSGVITEVKSGFDILYTKNPIITSNTEAQGEYIYPTIDDINKYEEILDVLRSDLSKSEDELLKQFEIPMNMTVQEIKDYLNWVMPYATGVKKLPDEDEPKFLELISYAETALENITGSKVDISVKKDDWKINKTLLRYVMTSNIKYDGILKETIIKIEFTDRLYEEYIVYQLKIDGKNIQLK